MSSLEKRQANRRGSTHGPRKCSDGISDTSSVGSFIDDTDREVSSLTDRAFRSLCIGEDAIYNDLEVSSPADQHKACVTEAHQKKDSRADCHESFAHGIQYKETKRKSEVASTFQHSYVDIAQAHVFRDEGLSYISNGSMETTWQQKRSTSRVSSLIKAFSSGESYSESGAPDTVKDKYPDLNSESWDKSALLSIQKELSEFSSGYHSNFKSGSLQSYGNYFHSVAQMNTATSTKTKFKALNTTNTFFHSELSPFQLWKDYNRFPFERGDPSRLVSATECPRWYDSALYKELTATHRIANSPVEGRHFTRRKIEDVAASQRSRSTVIQKASAIEKRCESEVSSNCPPWKNNCVKNKLPSNRPSTVSPTNEKVHRPDSSLLYHSRHAYEIQHKVGKVGSSEISSRITPFNITQLLTPVIPGRQETETSEVLQFAHTPLISESDSDLKPQSEAKQLRDSYKAKASSLLFNLKDNRKRVKSTYSPSKFKGLETADMNKHPSKLEGCESRLSEASGSKVSNQEHSLAPVAWELCNQVESNYELSLVQTAELNQYADKSHDNMTLVSQYDTAKCNIPYLSTPNHPDLLTNRESEHYKLSRNSGLSNSGRSPVCHNNGSIRKKGIQETENIFSKHPAHLSVEMAAKQSLYRREDAGHLNFEERNIVGNSSSGYMNNQVTEKNLSWKRTGPINMVTKEMVNNNGLKDAMPFKGEIAAMIEMDKQRKATANQYLPATSESYTIKKETCINKLNEKINMSSISKDKQFNDTNNFFQSYVDKHFSNKQVKDCHANTHAMSQKLHEHNFTRTPEITTHEKLCLQKEMKHPAMDIETESDYNQRIQFLQSMEEKYHYNEGSVAYQPYKYESNKQWHIATTAKCMSSQLQQSEIKAEQPEESNYVHSLSKASCIQQQRAAHLARISQRNWITEDRAKTEEHKPTYSIAPSQIYHKQGDMNTDFNIPNTQRTSQNDNTSQARGDRFNINDILSVRDNQQAKRIRENKHILNGRVGDSTKLENLTSPVTSDVSEDIAAKTEPSKVQSHALQDGVSHCKHKNISYGYVRKESHIPNDVKERPGKDIFINNENEKMTLRALSYKEKGQTKQEILTSKLKALAQKEISAIKEKGLAKNVIPLRNQIKQSTATNSRKGQITQEVLSPKKEITAEKLNHLFQDITYSSVSLTKEQKNQGKCEPKYESLNTKKVELPKRDIHSEKKNTANEKEGIKIQTMKPQEEKITDEDQKFVQNAVQSKEFQINKPSNNNEKEQCTNNSDVANGTILDKCFSRSPTLEVFCYNESITKKENKISSVLPTKCTSNITEYSTLKENGSPKHEVFVKAATNNKPFSLYNISEKAITHECSINKTKEQSSNVNEDKLTTDSKTDSMKCYDLEETSTSEDNTTPNASQPEMCTRRNKTQSDWTKDEAVTVEETTNMIKSKAALPDEQMTNSEKEEEHLQSGDSEISDNQMVLFEISPKPSCLGSSKPIEKESWFDKQDIQTEAIQTVKTTEDAFFHQPQNTDLNVDTLKPSQNASSGKELGFQTTLSLSNAESINLDSSEENKYSLQQEPEKTKLDCEENGEVQETLSQLNLKLKRENQNQQIISNKEVIENNDQQLQQEIERTPDNEHYKQKAKVFHEYTDSTPMENKQSSDKRRTYSSDGFNSTGIKWETSEEKLSSPVISINGQDQQLVSQPTPDKSAAIINPVSESHVIHIASKEEGSPKDEPVIYSICVSSTSEAVSEDEPIIFSISVSSLSDASITTGPEKQEKSEKQLSIEHTVKEDKETFSNKNKESDFLESKGDSKEVRLLVKNNVAEQETVVRKCDSTASKDKLDYYRSTEVDNISSSYESLFAKYVVPNGDTIHLESDQKEQNKKQGDEKEESTDNSLQKIQNNTMDIDYRPAEKMLTSADFTKKHSPESRKLKSPEASPKHLRNGEENHELCFTHSKQEHQSVNEGSTQRDNGVVHSERNNEEDVSAKQDILMSTFVSVCEDIVDSQSAKQTVGNGNVPVKESQQVAKKVQKMEKEKKDNDGDKNTEMVQVKCKNETLHRAGSLNVESLNHTTDLLQASSLLFKTSTNDQNRIKTQDTRASLVQNSKNTVNQTVHTKSSTLQYRTQEELEKDALQQEKVSKETGDNKALQNNKKELVCTNSDFPEPEHIKFMASNEVKASKVTVLQKEIPPFTNEQTQENSNCNQNKIKHAFHAEVSDGPKVDKEIYKNVKENQIKADAVKTRGAITLNNASENDQTATPAKFTGTKASSTSSMREDGLEGLANEKWKGEPAQKVRELVTSEITSLSKGPKTASSLIKGYKDSKCESIMSEENLKEEKAQPQDKNDEHFKKLIIDNTQKNTGEIEHKAGIKLFQENSGKVLGDEKDLSNVSHPRKEALPESQGSRYDGIDMLHSNKNSQNYDTVTTKKEETFTETEVTQKEKKMTRPEISALADYARLRVISAEEDTITEKDLLQKMNTYRKYNLSPAMPQKVNFSMPVGDTEQRKQLPVNKKSENSNTRATPLQVQERQTYKISDDILAGHNQSSHKGESLVHPNLGSLAKSLDDRAFAIKDTESTKEKTLTKNMQSNTKKALFTQNDGYSRSHEVDQATHPVRSQSKSKNDPQLKQPANANMLEKSVYPQVNKFQSLPQASIIIKLNDGNKDVENKIKEEVKNEEELQYYIVNAMESETKPKNNHEPHSLSHIKASKKELTEMNATAPLRSCTSSPAVGKHFMFSVKDNTAKPSSVTKTVRPHFCRSFSEEFRIGSPVGSCWGSEKDKAEYSHENDPKESANSPVFHEQSITSHQLPRAKEIQAQNKVLSPGLIERKEPRSYNRRSHMPEEDESQSLNITTSVEGLAASSEVLSVSKSFGTEHIRHTYARPESSCYERPESACYERPESACSDMRPACKPPTVPPKTDKALRRAKRLTTRRIKKVEDKINSETPVQTESKSIRTVSSLPSSPMVHSSTPQSVQSSPSISQYHAEPNYAPPAPSIVAHSFPMTQRRLLQDPNSGQIFMVDMPVQVKTKTFFDPETGKYLQLNVRQRSQSTSSQPASVEVLSPQYVVYPGFLPMPVSVSSSVRSSSQMSAPVALTEGQNQLKANHKQSEQEICEPECNRNVQQHNRPMYRTHEQTAREILHNENVRMTPRKTHIITMSELEDFAVENT